MKLLVVGGMVIATIAAVLLWKSSMPMPHDTVTWDGVSEAERAWRRRVRAATVAGFSLLALGLVLQIVGLFR